MDNYNAGKYNSGKLTGRTFFEVRHNTNKPFYVTAQGLTTRVLDTSFEVNAPGAGSAENIVTLHTGNVSIPKEGKEIARLYPDQQIRFQRSTGQYTITHVEAAYTLAWMKGELDYDQATL